MKFPESFEERVHPVVPGATQWLYFIPDNHPNPELIAGQTIISIVGGGHGLHGDGVDTFEMWDFREDNPHGYLTAEEINQHLQDHPLIDKP